MKRKLKKQQKAAERANCPVCARRQAALDAAASKPARYGNDPDDFDLYEGGSGRYRI